MYLDIWAPDDLNGTALGELSEAFDKSVRDEDQAIGEGSFRINRHSAQAAWCVSRALVRVRRVAGGPFAYDDSRYVFAFFIEDSADVALSPDEEGGENLTRGGRGVLSYLQRAIIYPNENISGHAAYWADVPTTGDVIFPNKTIGEAFRILILNAQQRAGVSSSPGPLDFLTIDFTISNDSNGDPWADTEDVWKFPVGMNLLDVASKLVASQMYLRITPALLLSCYDAHPGADLSSTITFAKAVDLTEAAEKTIEAQGLITRALVKGTRKDNRMVYHQSFTGPDTTSLEPEYGRIEGYAEYDATPFTARLEKVGRQAIHRAKLQSSGPTTAGVLELTGKVAWDDYLAGDSVTLDIPDVYDTAVVQVNAIIMTEDDAGDDRIALEFEDSPFDGLSGPGGFGSSTATGGPAGCNDCPEPPPFVPDVSGSTPVHAILYGPNNHPDRAFYPRVGFYGDGDTPPTGYASAPKAGPVEYVDRTVNGLTQRWALRVTADCTVDIVVDNITMAEVFRPGAWSATFRLLVNNAVVHAQVTAESCPDLCYFAYSYDHTETGYALHAGDVVSVEAFWSFGGQTVVVPAGTDAGSLSINGTAGNAVAANAPLQGQMVGEEVIVAASDTSYATNYPYEPNSLHVFAGGARINVTQTDPTAGTFEIPELPAGTRLFLWYQAASGTDLGTGNNPAPGAYAGLIPYPILGLDGDGTGAHVLHDDGTWRAECCDDDTTADPIDVNTLRTEVVVPVVGSAVDANLTSGTDSDGGGNKSFGTPTNANDEAPDVVSPTYTSVGSFAAGVSTNRAYLKADLGADHEVYYLEVWGDYECSTDPTTVSSIAPDGGWSIQYSTDGSSWSDPAYTAVRTGTPSTANHRVVYTLTTPVVARYWRVRYERDVLSGLAFMCGTDIHSFVINGAPFSGLDWAAGPEASDGDDTTYEQADDRIDSAFLRTDLGTATQIGRSRLFIGFSTSGAKTLTLYGANEDDFSDEVLLATETPTATGSFTGDELETTILAAAAYRYYRWKDSASQDRRAYTWELYPATVAESHTHALDDLSDVDTGGASDGDALVFDSGSSTWGPGVLSTTLAGLTDVDVSGVTDGDALVYDAGSSTWVPGTISAALAGLTDVDTTGVADGDSLIYDSGSSKWVPGSPDPADDALVWMPLTTVVGGVPELVWDANDSLIPTLEPV